MRDADDGRGYAYEEARDMWEISVHSVQFCFELKTAPKKNNVFFNGFYIHSYQEKKACHTMKAKHRSTGLVRKQKEMR